MNPAERLPEIGNQIALLLTQEDASLVMSALWDAADDLRNGEHFERATRAENIAEELSNQLPQD